MTLSNIGALHSHYVSGGVLANVLGKAIQCYPSMLVWMQCANGVHAIFNCGGGPIMSPASCKNHFCLFLYRLIYSWHKSSSGVCQNWGLENGVHLSLRSSPSDPILTPSPPCPGTDHNI